MREQENDFQSQDAKGKKPDLHVYVSMYMTFWKRQNSKGRTQVGGCQGLGVVGRDEAQGLEGLGRGLGLYYILIVVMIT